MTPVDWHHRFVQQAHWTQDLRAYLYTRIEFDNAKHILDMGCGTGALMGETLTERGMDSRLRSFWHLPQIGQTRSSSFPNSGGRTRHAVCRQLF